MKIAVVGCGGVGGVIAGTLACKGLDVTCVESSPGYARKLAEKGISIERKGKVVARRVKAVAGFSGVKDRFDLIVLAVKNFDLRSAFEAAIPRLADSGFILTIQNGLEVLSIAEEHRSVRVAAGAVGFNAVMLEYGRCKVNSEGGIVVGALTGGRSPPSPSAAWPGQSLARLVEIFGSFLPVSITPAIEGVLWGKLIVTCGVTGLGGAAGLLLGDLLRRRVARKLFYLVACEGAAVAAAAGVKVVKMGGAVNPVKFSSGEGGYPLFLRFLLLKLVGVKYKKLKSNIQVSLERGNRTEIDYINGALADAGARRGVPTPVNGEIVRIVKEIEAGKRAMGMKNLREIWEKSSRRRL